MTDQPYRVLLSKRAQKDLKKVRHDLKRALTEINRLASDPYAGHSLKEYLSDCRSLEFSLRGGGAYRAIYIVSEPSVICLVFLVGPHENIYDEALRRVDSARRSLEGDIESDDD